MQRCNSLNNRGVVNADRISELPEALILQILCLLPTEVAITTSVLSKQWQSHWKMMPNLKFDSYSHKLELENVCKSLLSHKAPVLQSFHLRVRLDGCNNAVDVEILIGILSTRNVRELVLEIYEGSFTIPRSLYNFETLETLKLWFNVVMDVPSSVCLKSLRTLHLYWPEFKDDESVVNLLSGCPNLEDLMVRRYSHSSEKTFTIAVPSLQRLTIENGYAGQENWGYVINAPFLKFLEIRGFYKAIKSRVIENLPELVEAYISDVSETLINEKLMVSLSSVKGLSLALSPLKFNFPKGNIFHQLVYLEFYTTKNVWWNLLTLMLGSSPKLQVLKLIDRFGFNDLVASGEWNQLKKVPDCLSFHLEILMWEGYKCKQEDNIALAKYILKNTNHLKRATFSFWERISSEERLEVVKDLKSVVKATNSCQFQFK